MYQLAMSICQLQRTVSTRLPTVEGEFQLLHYTNAPDRKEHLALVMGDLKQQQNVLVRVHSECFTGDVLGSQRCDCGEQLHVAMQLIADEGQGVVIYLRQEGRGIGLQKKLEAYNLQDQGHDTVDANLLLGHQADERTYEVAVAILHDLGVQSLRLLTNNPSKLEHLRSAGLDVVDRVPIEPTVHKENRSYLATKIERMRHLLALPPTLPSTLPATLPPTPTGASSTTLSGNSLSNNSLSGNSIVNSSEVGVEQRNRPSSIVHRHAYSDEETPQSNSIHKNGHHPPLPSVANEVVADLQAKAAAYFDRNRLPFVTLSYAQSIDGSIAAADGKPLQISGHRSMTLTHLLRATHDAILVGVGTVLADDPQLTVRLVAGPDPQPIILDTHLRTPPNARCLRNERRPWVATAASSVTPTAHAPFQEADSQLLATNVENNGHIALRPLLEELADRGIHSIMVEGGATVIRSFLQARIAQAALITIAPIFVGGLPVLATTHTGKTALQPQPASFPRLTAPRFFQLDDDLICYGHFTDQTEIHSSQDTNP